MTRSARLVLIAASMLALAACHRNREPEALDTGSAAATDTAAPDAKPGLSVSEGRLVLPIVSGNPGAAYFTLANGNAKPVTIAAVDVAGAGMAMLHETKQVNGHSEMGELSDPVVPAGGSITFAPGGKHVMVMDLPSGLKAGSTVEMTITFADGDKLSTPLKVEGSGWTQAKAGDAAAMGHGMAPEDMR